MNVFAPQWWLLLLALASAGWARAQTAANVTTLPLPSLPAVAATNDPGLDEKQEKVLSSLARERYGGRWTELTAWQLGQMRQQADAYVEDQRLRYLPHGLVASMRFADTNRTGIVAYEALDLSAAQTGYLLAAHAYRYAVTRDPKALTDVRQLLDGVELLLNSTDRPGYVPRFAGRADEPAYQAFYATYGGADPARPGLGKLAFPGKTTNGTALVWLAGPGRDQYSGLNFGLALVHKLVGNPGIRERVVNSMGLMLDRLEQDHWLLDDGRSNITFVTPLLKTALLRSGATMNPGRWTSQYSSNSVILLAQPARLATRYGDYPPNVAAFANLLTLCRLEKEERRRLQYQEQITQLWRSAEPQLNPFFAAAYVSAFDRTPNSAGALSTLQGMLFAFPAPPRWSRGTTNSTDAAISTVEANGVTWSRYALLFDQQPVVPFQWMQSPFRLDGPTEPLVAHAGVDYVLCFWMGRDAGLIPSEDAPPPGANVKRHVTTNSVPPTNRLSQPVIAPRTAP